MGRPQHFGHVARLVATVILCTAVYGLALPSSTALAQTNVNAKVRDDQPAIGIWLIMTNIDMVNAILSHGNCPPFR